jgi:hypothetical protein
MDHVDEFWPDVAKLDRVSSGRLGDGDDARGLPQILPIPCPQPTAVLPLERVGKELVIHIVHYRDLGD